VASTAVVIATSVGRNGKGGDLAQKLDILYPKSRDP
jgi:hypothetical protein